MLTHEQLRAIAATINQMPDLRGVRIGAYTGGTCRTVNPGLPTLPNFRERSVIIEEGPISGINIQSQQETGPIREVNPGPAFVRNAERFLPEVNGAIWACGFMALSIAGLTTATAMEAGSMGAATPAAMLLAAASWTGVATGGVACANALTRAGMATADSEGNSLQQLDSNLPYQRVLLGNDIANVTASLVPLPSTARSALAFLRLQARLATIEELMRMSRSARTTAIQTAITQVSSNQAHAAQLEQTLLRSGLQLRAGAASLSGVSHTIRRLGVVRRETILALVREVGLYIGSTTAALAVNSRPSSEVGGASGSINTAWSGGLSTLYPGQPTAAAAPPPPRQGVILHVLSGPVN
jgi:hypothetical protein